MVAAEDQLVARKTDPVRNPLNEDTEVGRRHAGIAALLIDLVAGRLDQHRHLRLCRPRRNAASITSGCAEQTDVMPRMRAAASAPSQFQRSTWFRRIDDTHASITTLVR